jgi:hypothetical protein
MSLEWLETDPGASFSVKTVHPRRHRKGLGFLYTKHQRHLHCQAQFWRELAVSLKYPYLNELKKFGGRHLLGAKFDRIFDVKSNRNEGRQMLRRSLQGDLI